MKDKNLPDDNNSQSLDELKEDIDGNNWIVSEDDPLPPHEIKIKITKYFSDFIV